MFDMRLDKSNFTEITLIHAICEMLYENHANFIFYDEKRVRKYVTESAIVKDILVNLFKDIFIIAERNINNIRENPVFNGWENILGLSF